jgi:hypothetical protein
MVERLAIVLEQIAQDHLVKRGLEKGGAILRGIIMRQHALVVIGVPD